MEINTPESRRRRRWLRRLRRVTPVAKAVGIVASGTYYVLKVVELVRDGGVDYLF